MGTSTAFTESEIAEQIAAIEEVSKNRPLFTLKHGLFAQKEVSGGGKYIFSFQRPLLKFKRFFG
ncbi:MAG: hypothetical protein J6M05_01460 [Cardiobacteriaceae bacterium]|nr:hypothetical protein [Cardiobacteriaceae bacterium]